MTNLRAAPVIGVFDIDAGRLVGVAPSESSDVSFFTTRDTLSPTAATVPLVLAQSGVPTILSSSATATTATGSVTGATALPYVPAGVVPVYMFLAALGGANQLYYARYSSTSAFQLYLDAAGTITPTGLTAGAYAGGTGEVTLVAVTVPGGAMGANGALRGNLEFSYPVTAGTKTLRRSIGGVTLVSGARTNSGGHDDFTDRFKNCGALNANSYYAPSESAATSAAVQTRLAVDTSVDKVLAYSGQLAAATDYLIFDSYSIEVLPFA